MICASVADFCQTASARALRLPFKCINGSPYPEAAVRRNVGDPTAPPLPRRVPRDVSLTPGAKGVLRGRGWAYAPAARGEAAVTRILELIEAEMPDAMALAGTTRSADIDRINLAEGKRL